MEPVTLLELPGELLIGIVALCDAFTLMMLECTCKSLRAEVAARMVGKVRETPKPKLWMSACESGRLEVLKYLHESGTPGGGSHGYLIMDLAARKGHLDVLRWQHANRQEGCSKDAMNCAAGNGHLDVVQWLHENRGEGCTTSAMDHAAHNGHLVVVKWLHENRREGCSTWAMDYAARNGHLNVVKWLHENRQEGCTAWAIERNRHLDVVQWLQENLFAVHNS